MTSLKMDLHEKQQLNMRKRTLTSKIAKCTCVMSKSEVGKQSWTAPDGAA